MKNNKFKASWIVVALIMLAINYLIYYLVLPAINVKAFEFWIWLMFLIGQVAVISHVYQEATSNDKIRKFKRLTYTSELIILVVIVIGMIASSKLFNAKGYYNIMASDIKVGDFNEYKANLNNVPLLDKDSADKLSNRKMGSLTDVVSQFDLGESYQITLGSNPIRVSILEYAGFFKWLNNKEKGTPGYIKVDMRNQNTELIRVEGGIKYSPSEYFGRDLKRYVRNHYRTEILGDETLEIDEDGNIYWAIPIEDRRVALFGGEDVKALIMVNAVTGDISYKELEDIPEWVDNVYAADLIIRQYDWYGGLKDGWLNYTFGQKGVVQTTEGYNYIPQENDIYTYTGVTSVVSDESNVGFILANKRNRATTYYEVTGAEEYSAMSSAQGAVQHLGYQATFPLLLNINGQATYVMALKDAGGLVKMYSMVNVERYQNVVTGVTIDETFDTYKKIMGVGIDINESESIQVRGIITDIRSIVKDGNTVFFIKIGEEDKYYVIENSEKAVLKNIGDEITIAIVSENAYIKE